VNIGIFILIVNYSKKKTKKKRKIFNLNYSGLFFCFGCCCQTSSFNWKTSCCKEYC